METYRLEVLGKWTLEFGSMFDLTEGYLEIRPYMNDDYLYTSLAAYRLDGGKVVETIDMERFVAGLREMFAPLD